MKRYAPLVLLLVPLLAAAQESTDPASGQTFDRYGRPVTSIASMCREGQMAGGPVTADCAAGGYLYDRQGEHLVRVRFDRWGYNLLATLPESVANRLERDPAYRAKYIEVHHVQPLPARQP